jgi:predicted MFS family arabinose efflux permease
LALLAWALSEIGPGAGGARNLMAVIAGAVLGTAALGGYALWERASSHPMTPPRLVANRTFVALNLATLMLYAGLSIMFFLLSFDLIDRRALSPTDAGFAFLPFTLGVGLLSQPFGALADKAGARRMLIAGSAGAALAYLVLAVGSDFSLAWGVIAPLALLGISFAVLVAPLTASVLSSVTDADEGLASGVNNAMSRVAQLIGVALAAGAASYSAGYAASLVFAALISLAAAATVAIMTPRRA